MTVNNLTAKTMFILIACDGIWDCFENEMAVKFINEKLHEAIKLHEQTKQPIQPSKILEAMFDNIVSPNLEVWQKGSDNMSACLLVFKKFVNHVNEPEPTGFAKF